MSTSPPVPARRPPVPPALVFLLLLAGLAAVALVTVLTPPRILTGLPVDPAVDLAHAQVRGRVAVDAGGLRFRAALLGAERPPGSRAAPPADAAAAARAEAALLEALGRLPGEARVHAALAALHLAAGRLADAERRYRAALDMVPTYGEARMGLGVTLVRRAEQEADAARARGLRLRAIAQFAAVPADDPEYVLALYDRARLLVRVDRLPEARRWARAYLARDSSSAWAAALRGATGAGR